MVLESWESIKVNKSYLGLASKHVDIEIKGHIYALTSSQFFNTRALTMCKVVHKIIGLSQRTIAFVIVFQPQSTLASTL